nr:MAG TPA: hypothetical protein [Bacteriophage sp.]
MIFNAFLCCLLKNNKDSIRSFPASYDFLSNKESSDERNFN